MTTEQPEEKKGLKRLIGKKVWVVQYDDDDISAYGIVEDVADGFIAIRIESETEPTLFVNIQNVKEIEIFREEDKGGQLLRLIRKEDTQLPN